MEVLPQWDVEYHARDLTQKKNVEWMPIEMLFLLECVSIQPWKARSLCFYFSGVFQGTASTLFLLCTVPLFEAYRDYLCTLQQYYEFI